MKAITKISMLAIALITFTSVNASETVGNDAKTIDASKSTVEWKGEKVTGEHTGTINIKEGSLEMKNDKLSGGSFVIDMSSIACTDLDAESGKGKLEGHLKSDDFFGVAKFPEAKLVITNAKEGDKKGTYTVTADLTIKGLSNPVTFTATIINDNGAIVANSNIIIDRTKYGVKYGSGSFFDNLGDKTIYDEFTLTVNLVTK